MILRRVERWLHDRLQAVAPVWVGHAPLAAPLPFIVVTLVAARDELGVGLVRQLVECRYQVVVYVAGASTAPAEPLADQVDGLLHGASDEAAGIVACWRERPLVLVERDETAEYRALGGEYVILAQ